jgi:outer membrane protein assembly factor BamB
VAWAKTVKPTPKDVDAWTHYCYDATRNGVSGDATVDPPNVVRWMGPPMSQSRIGGGRSSDNTYVQIGRAYDPYLARPFENVPGSTPGRMAQDAADVILWARDIHSGVPLWKRVISRMPARGYGQTSGYSHQFVNTFVAAGGRVYAYDFMRDEHVALTAWNIRTGAVERVFDQGAVFRKADAPLPDPDTKHHDWRDTAHEAFSDTMVAVHGGTVVQALRDRLYVMDAASGDLVWRTDIARGAFCRCVLVCGDRLIAVHLKPTEQPVYYRDLVAPYVAVQAWRLKDGKPLWRFTDLKGMQFEEDARRAHTFGCRDPYLVIPGLRDRAAGGRMLILLDTRDGRPVWEQSIGGMCMYTWSILNDEVWGARGHYMSIYDLSTGARKPFPTPPKPGACSVHCATPRYWIFMKLLMPLDQPRGADRAQWWVLRCLGLRCGEKVAPAYGSIYSNSTLCSCETHIPATAAFYAQRPVQPVADDVRCAPGRGETIGAVTRQTEAAKSLAAFGWGKPQGANTLFQTTYQRGGKRYALWQGYGRIETPPVEADGLTLTAYVHEHRLAASRAGREAWNFVAGGRIGSPPVIAGGKAVFGSHDGHVYAVNLKDGSLAWRFLAAPADRRHVVMGQVESAWPVFNVVLESGRLYCAAGRHEELQGGIHFWCLDPASGAVRWHVKRRYGLDTESTPLRQRASLNARQLQITDGRPMFNDAIEVRDGKIWLFEQEAVDLADPKDTIINPETLLPPQLGAAATGPKP